MSDKIPSLELLMRQQQQILTDFADFRDQLTVLTAICMRVEGSVNALTIEVRAMHWHDRLARRVTELEKEPGK